MRAPVRGGHPPVCRGARGVAQPGRAPALGAGCRRFESSRPDHGPCPAERHAGGRTATEDNCVMALARIYRPSKTAMQSGRRQSKKWLLEYEPASRRDPDPLMGWSSAADTLNEVQLRFETIEEAVAFADKHRMQYTIIEPHQRTPKVKSYADNFRYDRGRP